MGVVVTLAAVDIAENPPSRTKSGGLELRRMRSTQVNEPPVAATIDAATPTRIKMKTFPRGSGHLWRMKRPGRKDVLIIRTAIRNIHSTAVRRAMSFCRH